MRRRALSRAGRREREREQDDGSAFHDRDSSTADAADRDTTLSVRSASFMRTDA